jgi:hypothetical protein
MHWPYAVASVSLLTTNWKGDIFIIAGGVFLGNALWGTLQAVGSWWLSQAKNRELEEAIANGIARARAADRDRIL